MPKPLATSLTADKALVFRITHRENLSWILDNGLQCKNSTLQDPGFVTIGNTELIEKRADRDVPVEPGGTLSDYVPFYFTPYSPMMYNIHTGYGGVTRRSNEEIVVLVSSLHKIASAEIPFVFSDRHAYLQAAEFSNQLSDLGRVSFTLFRERDFRRDPENPENFERYQAEALVHQEVQASALLGVICYSEKILAHVESEVQSRSLTLRSYARPAWYFG